MQAGQLCTSSGASKLLHKEKPNPVCVRMKVVYWPCHSQAMVQSMQLGLSLQARSDSTQSMLLQAASIIPFWMIPYFMSVMIMIIVVHDMIAS